MTQKFIVNGVSYDSVVDMPPDVREQYERAIQMMKEVGKAGSSEKTVKPFPGGLSINVEQRQVCYTIDGKTYNDPAQLPPEIRAKIDQCMADVRSPSPEGRGGQGVRLVQPAEKPLQPALGRVNVPAQVVASSLGERGV